MVVDNHILSNIIPHISTEERYNLFIMLDELLEGNYKEKSRALEVKQSAYYQYKKKYLFCWDDVPENNKQLKSFLKTKFAWVRTATIDRVNNNKTIRVYKKNDDVYFIINDEKTKVEQRIGKKRYGLTVIKENGKFNVYNKILEISDPKTMLMLKLLHDRDVKKFNDFLYPIVSRSKKQISILEEGINSGLFELDLDLIEGLFDIHQRYEAKKAELAEKK